MKSSKEIIELIEIIRNVSNQMDVLNKKMEGIETKMENIATQIIYLKTNSKLKIIELPTYIPTQTWKEWIKILEITKEHMNYVYMNSIIDGLKECLKDHLKKENIPIYCIQKKELYIFNESWECMESDHLKDLMREIWKKMMILSLNDDDTITEEMQDANKKKIYDMKKKMEEKYKEFQRWIISYLK